MLQITKNKWKGNVLDQYMYLYMYVFDIVLKA